MYCKRLSCMHVAMIHQLNFWLSFWWSFHTFTQSLSQYFLSWFMGEGVRFTVNYCRSTSTQLHFPPVHQQANPHQQCCMQHQRPDFSRAFWSKRWVETNGSVQNHLKTFRDYHYMVLPQTFKGSGHYWLLLKIFISIKPFLWTSNGERLMV